MDTRLYGMLIVRPNGKFNLHSHIMSLMSDRMIPEPGETDRGIPVPATFHEQTDDELIVAEIKQMEADDQAIQTILLGLPEDIYAAVDSCETAQKSGLSVQQMMNRSDIGIQKRRLRLFNDESLTSTNGNRLSLTTLPFSKLRMILRETNTFPETIASNLKFPKQLTTRMESACYYCSSNETTCHTTDYTHCNDFLKVGQDAVQNQHQGVFRMLVLTEWAIDKTQLLIAQKEEAGNPCQAEELIDRLLHQTLMKGSFGNRSLEISLAGNFGFCDLQWKYYDSPGEEARSGLVRKSEDFVDCKGDRQGQTCRALPLALNDREDMKLGAKGDIGFFIGYSADVLCLPGFDKESTASDGYIALPLTVSTCKPKNVKEAMTESAMSAELSIYQMQEELHSEFKKAYGDSFCMDGWHTKAFTVFQIDVKTAFLAWYLKRNVYVCQLKVLIDADHPQAILQVKERALVVIASTKACTAGKQNMCPLSVCCPDPLDADTVNGPMAFYFNKIPSTSDSKSAIAYPATRSKTLKNKNTSLSR
ncbi:hypothetical protein Tco_0525105 [Tanacetum coccineum]